MTWPPIYHSRSRSMTFRSRSGSEADDSYTTARSTALHHTPPLLPIDHHGLDGQNLSPVPSHDTITSLSPVPNSFMLGSPAHSPQHVTATSPGGTAQGGRVLQQPVPFPPLELAPSTETVQHHVRGLHPAMMPVSPIPSHISPGASLMVHPSAIPTSCTSFSRRRSISEPTRPGFVAPAHLLSQSSWTQNFGGDSNTRDNFGLPNRRQPSHSREMSHGENRNQAADAVPKSILSPQQQISPQSAATRDHRNPVVLRRANPRQSYETIRAYTYKPPWGQRERTYTWRERQPVTDIREEYVMKTPPLSPPKLVVTAGSAASPPNPATHAPNVCNCPVHGDGIVDGHPGNTRFVIQNTDAEAGQLEPVVRNTEPGEPIPETIAQKVRAPKRFRDNRHWISDRTNGHKRRMVVIGIIFVVVVSMTVGFAISRVASRKYEPVEYEKDSESSISSLTSSARLHRATDWRGTYH